ncbi:MAG TPA: NUDIX domain-containing protein [Ignavibacteria bacterium]|nr:NUDIX domain-containing protein [Ignavibacteria bacterium]
MKIDYAFGVVIFKKFPRSVKILVLKDSDKWGSFPKGHREKGEKILETAKRELFEETGIKKINLVSKKVLLKQTYDYKNKSGKTYQKINKFFFAEVFSEKVKIDMKEVSNYKWLTEYNAVKIAQYVSFRKTVKEAFRIIKKYYKGNYK